MDDIDFSDFSNDDFDPVNWLNSIFSSDNDENKTQNKEIIATNMVYKLQLMVEETNNSLEDIAQRMAQSIPKVIGEAEVLNREASELYGEVVDVRTKLICAVQQSSDAVNSLIQLDQTKNRFETLIEPILMDAFITHNSKSIEFYSQLFKDLHRSDRLLTCYHHCLRDQLLREWTTQVKLDSEETLLNWLNFLYDRIEQNIVDQYSGTEKIDEFVPRVSSFDIFIRTIYRPFATFNEIFIQLEKDRLMAEFDSIKLKYSDSDDGSSKLISSECIIKLFVIARHSLKLYSQYVESYPILVVDCVIEKFLIRFFGEFRNHLQNNIICHLINHKGNNQVISSQLRRTESGNNFIKMKQSYSNSSLYNTMSNTSISPNWHLIQQALFSCQMVGEFFLQLDKFDIFILNLDSNIELRDQIENHLHHSIPPSSSILSKVWAECVNSARISAQTLCDTILEYVHLQLSTFINMIYAQMNQNSAMNTTNESMDDDLSFSPNEYITQIGQYLLTLPQHLEPFNLNENESLKTVLKYAAEILVNGSDQSTRRKPSDKKSRSKKVLQEANNIIMERIENATTEQLLDSILRLTTRAFLDYLLDLATNSLASSNVNRPKPKLTVSIRKQISVDLAYLVAVCDDLGLTSKDEEFILLIQLLNDVNSIESFQQMMEKNPKHIQMFQSIASIIPFNH
ncbi:Golgi transport complex subunit 7 [Blomia tropicalis]|nr:Golgi transport complex subunit 7 [Blomia tropicalis]